MVPGKQTESVKAEPGQLRGREARTRSRTLRGDKPGLKSCQSGSVEGVLGCLGVTLPPAPHHHNPPDSPPLRENEAQKKSYRTRSSVKCAVFKNGRSAKEKNTPAPIIRQLPYINLTPATQWKLEKKLKEKKTKLKQNKKKLTFFPSRLLPLLFSSFAKIKTKKNPSNESCEQKQKMWKNNNNPPSLL